MTCRTAISILGSTGSIGESTLDVVRRNHDRYRILALTAHRNVVRLAEQCVDFAAEVAVIGDARRAADLARELRARGSSARVLAGEEGLIEAATLAGAEVVMAAIVGAAGLRSTFAAAQAGKKILLANKESLVIAGGIFMQAAQRGGAVVLPVDSEHNAVFQSLPAAFAEGLEQVGVSRIILTASGGPFLDLPADRLRSVTPGEACKHPNWDMGRKISVDSATLMNKGLELIEARWLFNATAGQLDVVIHPQSVIHSMVEYRDGSVLAQLGMPDMRTPIAHALAWPERIDAGVERLNLAKMADLSFREPDLEQFPCLGLAFAALRAGPAAPVILNAANELAVEAFLDSRIRFDQIARVVESVLEQSETLDLETLQDVLDQDGVARERARCVIRDLL